jgi:hypothetical protein
MRKLVSTDPCRSNLSSSSNQRPPFPLLPRLRRLPVVARAAAMAPVRMALVSSRRSLARLASVWHQNRSNRSPHALGTRASASIQLSLCPLFWHVCCL